MSLASTILDDYASNLLGYWKGNEPIGATIFDFSGNNHHLSLVAGSGGLNYASLLGDGTFDTCVGFAGNTYCDLSHASWMDVAAVSVFIRIQPTSTSGLGTIFCVDDTGGGSELSFRVRRNGTQVDAFYRGDPTGVGSGSGTIAAANDPYPTDPAYSVGYVHTGTRERLYLDGVKVADVAASALPAGTGRLRVGRLLLSEGFVGLMLPAAMWGVALTDADMAALHVAATTTAPPDPPEDLAADPASNEIDLTWSAPSTGDAPTGYDVRIDGGAPTDVGLTLAHTFTGLASSTTYLLEVRAYTTAGDSDWASIEATTDLVGPTVPYAAKIRIGSHTWDIDQGDPADPDNPEVLAGASFVWTAPDNIGWPPPMWAAPRDVVQLRLRVPTASAVEDVRKGDVVRFKFVPLGYDFGYPLVDFAGVVSGDPVIIDDPTAGVFLTVTASDHTIALANWTYAVGNVDWTVGASGDTRQEVVQAICAALDSANLGNVPGDFGDATVGAVDPQNYLLLTLGADYVIPGDSLVSAMSLFAGVGYLPVPQYDDDGNLDPVQPFRIVEVDAYGRDYVTPDPVPANLVPSALIEWRRDYAPTVVEVAAPLVDTHWQGEAQGVTAPTDMSAEVVARIRDASNFNITGLMNEIPETEPWGPYSFTVRAYLDPLVVQHWFTYPDRVRQYIGIDGIETIKNPSGGATVSGMLRAASLTVGPKGRWSVQAGMRRHHFDAALP